MIHSRKVHQEFVQLVSKCVSAAYLQSDNTENMVYIGSRGDVVDNVFVFQYELSYD